MRRHVKEPLVASRNEARRRIKASEYGQDRGKEQNDDALDLFVRMRYIINIPKLSLVEMNAEVKMKQ